jgi:hypothetical protein
MGKLQSYSHWKTSFSHIHRDLALYLPGECDIFSGQELDGVDQISLPYHLGA